MEVKESPREKWNREHGYISKSYKLKIDIVESFAEACQRAGVSQAGQLTRMMKSFIDQK